jgi:hypothetical protein
MRVATLTVSGGLASFFTTKAQRTQRADARTVLCETFVVKNKWISGLLHSSQ